MKKIFFLIVLVGVLIFSGYLAFLYYVPYSDGNRSGELIKFSRKGFLVKTWEGEISQGIGEDRTFYFSVYRDDKEIIDKLIQYSGRRITVTYEEHFGYFFYWGKTKYFITSVRLDNLPQNTYQIPSNGNQQPVGAN